MEDEEENTCTITDKLSKDNQPTNGWMDLSYSYFIVSFSIFLVVAIINYINLPLPSTPEFNKTDFDFCFQFTSLPLVKFDHCIIIIIIYL